MVDIFFKNGLYYIGLYRTNFRFWAGPLLRAVQYWDWKKIEFAAKRGDGRYHSLTLEKFYRCCRIWQCWRQCICWYCCPAGGGHRVLAVRTVFFIYLVCVLGVTLLPVLANLPKLAGNHYALMELEPFRDLRNGYGNAARQLSLNVVMTVPFGFLWPLVRRKHGLCRAVLAALLLSLCIELLQPLLTTNRTSDITDVIANTAGGLVGYLLFLPFGSRLLHLCGAEDRPRNLDEMPASADNAKNGEGENQDKF